MVYVIAIATQAVGAPAAAAEHKAKKQKLEQQQQQQSPQHNQAAAVAVKPGMEPWQQPSSGKPHKSAAAAATSGVKAKLGSSKTKFYEMLEADGVAAAATGAASNSAFLADLKMEREMARKLKIKKVGNCASTDASREKPSSGSGCRCSCNIACQVARYVCLFGSRWNHL